MNSMLRDATAFMARVILLSLTFHFVGKGGGERRKGRGGGVELAVSVIPPASRPCAGRRNKSLRTRRGSSAPRNFRGPQAGDARITTVGAQPAGFGEFGGGEFGLAFEGIGGGEPGVRIGSFRIGAARLFEPDDRLVGARLQQMHDPDLRIPIAERGSRGLRRMACSWSGIISSIDPVKSLHWPRANSAPTQLRLNASTVSYSGMASSYRRCARSTWPLAKCASGLRGDAAKACPTSSSARAMSAAAESVIPLKHAAMSALANQPCASTEPRIERQRALEQADRFRIVFTRRRLRPLRRVPGKCSPARRDSRSAGRPPRDQFELSAIAMRLVISFCSANRSLVSRSNRSAHRCASVSASISWALTRPGCPTAGRCLRAHSARLVRGRSALC